jgi:hypothetical protein
MMKSMVKIRSTLAIALLFMWTGAPALRCLVPGETLTSQEQACCKSIAGQCGDSTASTHPCCKIAGSTAQPALAAAQATVRAAVPFAATISAPADSVIVPEFSLDSLVGPSPPPLLKQSSPILRI